MLQRFARYWKREAGRKGGTGVAPRPGRIYKLLSGRRYERSNEVKEGEGFILIGLPPHPRPAGRGRRSPPRGTVHPASPPGRSSGTDWNRTGKKKRPRAPRVSGRWDMEILFPKDFSRSPHLCSFSFFRRVLKNSFGCHSEPQCGEESCTGSAGSSRSPRSG